MELERVADRRKAASSDAPPGWDYNPSAWSERIPIVAAAFAGTIIAAYLALYQYRVVGDVWEPFFGSGSRRILDSPISHLLPVSDAALGAIGFLLDAASGAVGGPARWRTMPWLVLLFGLLVGPLGAVSVALVVAQPVAYGAWCTLCLATAVLSVVMIGPAMDEVLATLQHVRRERARGGRSLLRILGGR
jgi:hypothetical protein